MSLLIELAIYAAIAAALAFGVHKAWDGFKGSISAPYVEAQRQADQKVVNAANAAQAAAEADVQTSKGNLESCRTAAQAQADQVTAWKAQADRNAVAAREARVAAANAATAQAPYIADLQARAAAAPRLQSCEAELKQSADVIRDELRRQRGRK